MSRYVYGGSTRPYDRSSSSRRPQSPSASSRVRDEAESLSRQRYLTPSTSSSTSRYPQSASAKSTLHRAHSFNASAPSRTPSSPPASPPLALRRAHSFGSTTSSSDTFSSAVLAAAANSAAALEASTTEEMEPQVAAAPGKRVRSRMRRVPPKRARIDFIALGKPEQTENPYKATYHGSEKYRSIVRSRSHSVGRQLDSTPTANNEELEWEPPPALPATPIVPTNRFDARAEEKTTQRWSKSASRSRRSRSSSSERDESRPRSYSRKQSAKSTSPSSSPPRSSSRRDDEPMRSRSKSSSRRYEEFEKRRRSRSKSKTRELNLGISTATTATTTAATAMTTTIPSTPTSVSASMDGVTERNIDAEIQAAKESIQCVKQELEDLQNEYAKLMEAKQYRIRILELDLETLEKRKRIDLEYTAKTTSVVAPRNVQEEEDNAPGHPHRAPSKRPCIVDSDESDDDDVIILDPVTMKEEQTVKDEPGMKPW
ncbi:hypothetical protein FI667_g6749, partial [Globisporangium splendens]